VYYFEYGPTPALGFATLISNGSSDYAPGLSATITGLVPNKTYYFRIAARVNGRTVQGNVVSFNTLDPNAKPVVVNTDSTTTGTTASGTTTGKSTGTTGSNNGSSTTGGGSIFGNLFGSSTDSKEKSEDITLTVTNKGDKIFVGDDLDYTVTYTNGTSKKLSNATLSIIFPQGFTVTQTTKGQILNPTAVTIPIGDIVAGKTDSFFLKATAGKGTATGETLLTNATLSYTLPDGSNDSTIGYALNHASVQNIFAGFALGTGFFPSTIFGWFFTFIIILVIIILARRIARAKMKHHGHGGHGDDHAPKH
jgi:hypothetical protein